MMLKKLSAYIRLMRLNRPGVVLYLWPALWALWVAGQGSPQLKHVIIFILGAFIMRSAGCIMSDIADRHIDKQVKRTAMRPLAAGEVSVTEAFILLAVLLILAAILVFYLNFLSFVIALIGVILAAIYPLTKRWINCPQFVLGLSMATSVPIAFAAEINQLNMTCALMYVIAVLSPIAYDTQYAMADREEDKKIKVKSTAIWFGRYDILIISLIQVMIILLLSLLGFMLKAGFAYAACIAIAAGLFIYQYYLIARREPEKCFKAFVNNEWAGAAIFLSVLLSYI